MDLNFLDFEQPIAELEAKIEELRFVGDDSEVNISDEIERLKEKSEALTRSIFASLSSWQVAQLARHPLRPYTLDYLEVISPDFQELHGERMFADDPAIVGGLGQSYGAIAGGFLIGFAETAAIFNCSVLLKPIAGSLPFDVPQTLAIVPTEYKLTVAFVILVVVLLWRPTGIFKGASS